MDFKIGELTNEEAEYIWEKINEIVPSEVDSDDENFVLKIENEVGEIIGGCVVDIDEMKAAEIERLWVDERYRNRGIGSALIQKAEHVARQKSCESIINTYIFDFQAARKLFEGHGYRLIGTVRDWPKGHENYALIKTLDCCSPANSFGQARFEIQIGNEDDGEVIASKLEAYNRSFAPRSHAYMDIDKKIVDDKGSMIAGCIAGVNSWDTLHIDAFWADEHFHDSEIDSFLLEVIEREAKEKGAYLSNTAVMDLQAAFFAKHGYEVSIAFEKNKVVCAAQSPLTENPEDIFMNVIWGVFSMLIFTLMRSITNPSDVALFCNPNTP